MNELKERQNQVAKVEGAQCPFCEQDLSPQHRQNLIEKLELEGKAMAEQWHDNRYKFQEADLALKNKNQSLQTRDQNQSTLQTLLREADRLEQLLIQNEQKKNAFESDSAPKIQALETELKNEAFLPETRLEIQKIEQELSKLGYDVEAHAAARRNELLARDAESAYHELGKARGTVEQIKLSLKELEIELKDTEKERDSQEEAFKKASAELAAEEAGLPDLRGLERDFVAQKEAEASLLELGVPVNFEKPISTRNACANQNYAMNKKRSGSNRGNYAVLRPLLAKTVCPPCSLNKPCPNLKRKQTRFYLNSAITP